jgi:hypothetical protein
MVELCVCTYMYMRVSMYVCIVLSANASGQHCFLAKDAAFTSSSCARDTSQEAARSRGLYTLCQHYPSACVNEKETGDFVCTHGLMMMMMMCVCVCVQELKARRASLALNSRKVCLHALTPMRTYYIRCCPFNVPLSQRKRDDSHTPRIKRPEEFVKSFRIVSSRVCARAFYILCSLSEKVPNGDQHDYSVSKGQL